MEGGKGQKLVEARAIRDHYKSDMQMREEEKEELLKEVEDGKREGEEKLESSIETMNPFGSFTKERRNGPKAPDTVSFPLEERNLHMVAVSTTSPAAAIPNSPLAALQSPSSPPPPARPSTLRMVAVSTSPAIPNSTLAALPKQSPSSPPPNSPPSTLFLMTITFVGLVLARLLSRSD
ncbi:hypothetical protein YC2023_052761 [Brassica napus]